MEDKRSDSEEDSDSGEEMTEEEIANYKRRRLYDTLPLQTPHLNDRNRDEINRLAAREIPPARAVDDDACCICYSKDHPFFKCPCVKKIPSDIKVLSPEYDWACLGCGKLGKECCSAGSYAVRKMCYFCLKGGHWYWEERCPEDYPGKIRIQYRWKCFKEGKSTKDRPLQIPDFKFRIDVPEVWRLANRKISEPVDDECCTLCYDQGHKYYECPYVESIPPGMVVGPDFDVACAGCGKIGEGCCDVGAYPTNKWCPVCYCQGHWYWENKHNPHHDAGYGFRDSGFGEVFNNFIDKITPEMEMIHGMKETKL
ncbi:hypothetical protein ACHQM5_000060 [Ranunculus cassubicifolius]